MLLEVTQRPPGSSASFLCEISVHMRVDFAVAQIAELLCLRERLAAALASKNASVESAATDAAALLSQQAVSRKVVLTRERLEEAITAVAGTNATGGGAEAEGSGLFFAGRWLEMDKPLSTYVGHNEKSKVKVGFGTMASTQATDAAAAAAATTSAAAVAAAASGEKATGQQAHSCTDGHADGSSSTSTGGSGGRAETAAATGDGGASATEKSVSLISFFQSVAGGKRPRPDDSAPAEAERHDDEDMPLLSAQQAAQLINSSEVRAALRDERLQGVLRHIDSASTREGALRRLEAALGTDPDFEQFTLSALREIGHDVGDGRAA